MNLIYSTTRTLTTADMGIACDPPIFFSFTTKVDSRWATESVAYLERGENEPDITHAFLSSVLKQVWQDEENKYQIQDGEDVVAVRDAIGEEGEDFLFNVLDRFVWNHLDFLARNSERFGESLQQLNGTGTKKTPVVS